MGLWIKNDDGSIEKVAGSGGGGGSFDGEHVLTGDVDNPPEELDVGQLMWDGVEGGSGGGGGDGGPHNHDYLPLEGGTLTGGLIVGGRLEVANAAIRGYDGNETWPAFTFQSDTRSGVYLQSAGTLCMTANGQKVGSWDFNAIGGRFFGPGHTAGSAIIGERYDDGNDAYPPYRFYGDEKTGFYLKQSGVVGVSGDLQADGSVYAQGDYLVGQYHRSSVYGTASWPCYSFSDEPNTGMFLWAENELAFSLGGQLSAIHAQRGTYLYQPQRAQVGTLAEPTYSFQDAPDVGFYLKSTATRTIGISGRLEGSINFRTAPGIDTRDVLERAETATMPVIDDEGVATTDAEVDSITVNEVVTALLAKVKELSAEIEELKGA